MGELVPFRSVQQERKNVANPVGERFPSPTSGALALVLHIEDRNMIARSDATGGYFLQTLKVHTAGLRFLMR